MRHWINILLETAGSNTVIGYHGSRHLITDKFRIPGNRKEKAVFFSDDKEEAEEWSGPYLYEATIDVSRFITVNYKEINDPDDQYYMSGQSHLYDPDTMLNILSQAQAEGAKGVIINDIQNFEDGRITTTYAVLDPSAILSFRRIDEEIE